MINAMRNHRIGRIAFALIALMLSLTVLSPLGAYAASDVLYDQTGPLGYSANIEGYENASDFAVPSGTVWTVNQVAISAFSQFATVPVTIALYKDAGGQPGDRIYQSANQTASVDGDNLLYTLSAPATLGSGTYWMGVSSNQSYVLRLLNAVMYGAHDQYRTLSNLTWGSDTRNSEMMFHLSGTHSTLTYSPSIEVISAPHSVVENTLESNTLIRMFPERLSYTLPQAITVDGQGAPGTVIPAGTKVNVYYIHADKVGNTNTTSLKLTGSITFDTKILAVLTNGTSLLNTHASLGNTQDASTATAYSSSVDQGIDYGDTVTMNGQQNQVNVSFNLWSMTDDVRVITLAP